MKTISLTILLITCATMILSCSSKRKAPIDTTSQEMEINIDLDSLLEKYASIYSESTSIQIHVAEGREFGFLPLLFSFQSQTHTPAPTLTYLKYRDRKIPL